ncbi:hypothetical protein EEJ42_16875, partial [Streptomyces botrytidirepellens]
MTTSTRPTPDGEANSGGKAAGEPSTGRQDGEHHRAADRRPGAGTVIGGTVVSEKSGDGKSDIGDTLTLAVTPPKPGSQSSGKRTGRPTGPAGANGPAGPAGATGPAAASNAPAPAPAQAAAPAPAGALAVREPAAAPAPA